MNDRYPMIGARSASKGIDLPHGPCSRCGLRSMLFYLVVAFATLVRISGSLAHTATAERYMIATVHPMATDAGLEVFRDGGNAIDAAVTAALTLGVVDGENSGIGGGCLILIRTADGEFTGLYRRQTRPAG